MNVAKTPIFMCQAFLPVRIVSAKSLRSPESRRPVNPLSVSLVCSAAEFNLTAIITGVDGRCCAERAAYGKLGEASDVCEAAR
jgi:hypothetical protein